ncbi:hypothetical protein [Arthrobacter sp. KK5.5]|uniref:hypothetical protein n=1 Tax=Arthrobacter sp. KK5.5 TaxID=3373084 RepID=UPI003EE58255
MKDKPRNALTRPPSIAVVAALLSIEALAVLAAGVVFGSAFGQSGPVPMTGRIFMLVLILAAGAGLVWVAVNVFRGRPWTRAAALVWQVFQVIFAVPLTGGSTTWLGWALLVPAAAIIILLFDPRATAFFGDRAERGTR